MATTASTPEKTASFAFDTQRVAWLVLSVAFTVFCLLCATTSFGIYYYLYRSTIPITSGAQVTRGYVQLIQADLNESFEVDRRALSRGERLITDSQSQTLIEFQDTQIQGQSVASVTVKNNTEVVVQGAQQPRFERSGLGYAISILGVDGEVDVFVPPELPRDVVISLFLRDDVVVNISEAGSYSLSFGPERAELVVWNGQAAILPPEREASRPVVAGQVGMFEWGGLDIQVETGYENLMGNSILEDMPLENMSQSLGGTLLPAMEAWNCSDRTPTAPNSIFEPIFFDGRQAFRLFRGIGTRSHGETNCVHLFGPSGQVGRPVTDYNFLEVRTTFYIESHSLVVCGVAGSECPMMLLMDYIDENGDSNQWFHGFYANSAPGTDFPQTCVSCSTDHKQINTETWYTYESGNLFTLLPEGARPASILNVRFYASGHDYDVRVSDVSLIAAPVKMPQIDGSSERSS